MKIFPAPAILALTAFIGSAAAQQQSTYSLIGQGSISCKAWAAGRHEESTLGPEQWILGFLSGAGFYGGPAGLDPLKGMDAKTVLAWVDKYCQGRPLDTLATASAAFANAHPH